MKQSRVIYAAVLIVLATLSFAPMPTIIPPFQGAPECPLHDNSTYHGLWDDVLGCHYDHEHGTNPFTPEVAAVFPDIQLFLGGSQIGHSNPSSPIENTNKHGGFKWDVVLTVPHACVAGFEGGQYCVTSAVIQYHNFGDYSHEMEHSIHSAAAFLIICNPAQPTDCGELRTIQHLEFGQRIVPYQGTLIPYPDTFTPSYPTPSGQYFSIDCVGSVAQCRPSLNFIVTRKAPTNSIWTSRVTGTGSRPPGSNLLKLLFRVRDTYQVFDWNDFTYPFTFRYVCGDTIFNPTGCRWNNSTSTVHEVHGTIPEAWDNLEGFDINPMVGRITGTGWTDRFGNLDLTCIATGETCFPLQLTNMFVGKYADYLTPVKVSGTSPTSNPERDICFNVSGVQVSCDTNGAIPSGWIGAGN